MAQLIYKYRLIIIIIILLSATVFALFMLPFSSIETTDNSKYLVSLDGKKYSQKLNLKYGTYSVYVKTPYHLEKTEVNVSIFDNKKLDISIFETEGGIEQVAQQYMFNLGFPGTEINKCIELGEYYFVCESYQLSSTRAVELSYENADWKINIDPNKANTPQAKDEMIMINRNNNQR